MDGTACSSNPNGQSPIEIVLASYPLGDKVATMSLAHRLPDGERIWGVFVPLYALRSGRNWGAGDTTDLQNLIDWVADLGGRFVATLPLLATEWREGEVPCPYQPTSRLDWSAFYIDPEKVAGFHPLHGADRLRTLRESSLVDYQGVMACKTEALRSLVPMGSSLEEFLSVRMKEQLHRIAEHARRRSVFLYLDLPLGIHPCGRDAARFRSLFIPGESVGAPPDEFFSNGQNWNCHPPDPSRIPGEGGDYWRAVLRHHMEFAGILRIDHVMGLHRLFWIPDGEGPEKGRYISYPYEAYYDILCEESRAHRTLVVGEDLGTVPPDVRPAMREHGLYRTVVIRHLDEEIPEDCVVCLGTHDMPPFAAWHPAEERTVEALKKYLDHLASSPAAMMMVNLEDLWLETERQNTPGTVSTEAHPNWRRKTRLSFEEFREKPDILEILQGVDRRRRGVT